MSPVDPAVPDRPVAPSRAEVGPALVTVTDLHKAFGAARVLDGVDLTVHRGEVLAVIGSSGSGKTTLLRCVAGLERAAKGRIAIEGETWQDARSFVPTWQRPLGYVFQEASLFDHLDVRGNLAFARKRASGAAGLNLRGIQRRFCSRLSVGLERLRV